MQSCKQKRLRSNSATTKSLNYAKPNKNDFLFINCTNVQLNFDQKSYYFYEELTLVLRKDKIKLSNFKHPICIYLVLFNYYLFFITIIFT